jgi:very-short-patch-repair endonuclease
VIVEKTPAEQRTDDWRAAALRVGRAPIGALACRQGFVVTPAQARDAGLASCDVRRLVRRGQWTAPRRGVLCVLARPDGERTVHGLRPEIVAAAVALVRPAAAISHECAALAYGLDVLHEPSQATMTVSFRDHAASRSGALVHAAKVSDGDVTTWFGAKIMSCPRTVIDIARQGARHGIVVADSALRNELVTLDELRAAMTAQWRWHGVTAARRVVELASGKSESALESLARLFLADHEIPLPEQQIWIKTHRGWYRVDGLWAEQRVVLEVDGLAKYRTSDPDDDPLVAEKLRQEALERAGYTVIRVTWADIHLTPRATLVRILAVLRRAGLVLQPRPTKFSA